jgi:hypothetical protein
MAVKSVPLSDAGGQVDVVFVAEVVVAGGRVVVVVVPGARDVVRGAVGLVAAEPVRVAVVRVGFGFVVVADAVGLAGEVVAVVAPVGATVGEPAGEEGAVVCVRVASDVGLVIPGARDGAVV